MNDLNKILRTCAIGMIFHWGIPMALQAQSLPVEPLAKSKPNNQRISCSQKLEALVKREFTPKLQGTAKEWSSLKGMYCPVDEIRRIMKKYNMKEKGWNKYKKGDSSYIFHSGETIKFHYVTKKFLWMDHSWEIYDFDLDEYHNIKSVVVGFQPGFATSGARQ